jgi:hypothetical protein
MSELSSAADLLRVSVESTSQTGESTGLPKNPRALAGHLRYGFNSRELARILRVFMDHRDPILRAWHEHFGYGSSI